MHTKQKSSVLVDGALIISNARAVRCSDLSQRRLRLRHHIGNPKRTADLNQFPAGDNHLSAFCQRIERKQHRSGVVIDHDRGSRRTAEGGRSCVFIEQLLKEPIYVDVALATLARR